MIRDISEIDHFGTGDIEIKVESKDDIELAKSLIEEVYDNSESLNHKLILLGGEINDRRVIKFF